ncbi:hypothetical protein FJY63_03840, partial [Candidatus Sumerlaeota bacterium]|nr:hypothetical protein [Candidatus Sumerlaeota bacterium]
AASRRFPYVAWKDPFHQVGQSPHASVEALYEHLVFGGGLASCDNERLLVLSPRAAGYDIAERVSRFVLLYNPTDAPEKTLLTVHYLPAKREYEVLVGNTRVAKGVGGDRVADIPVEVPSRRAVAVAVEPTRAPTALY